MNASRLKTSKEWEGKAIRHTILLTGSVVFSQVLLAFRGFVVANFLGPNLYGLWHGLRIIINHSEYCSLGIFEGMKREVPYYRGQGKKEKVEELVSTAFVSGILLVSFISCILIGASLLYPFDRVTVISLWIVAAVLLARQFYLFFCKRLESEGRFFSLSKIQLIWVWIGVPLAIGLMFVFHLFGFLIGILLSYFLAALVASRGETAIKRSLHLTRPGLELMKVGLPIILIGLLLSVLRSMDKVMVLFFWNRTELGYYGMAFVIAGFAGFFPASFRSVLYPRLMEKFGEKNDKLYLKGFLTEPCLTLACLMPVLMGAIYLFGPVAIRMLLPQYILSIPSLKILSLAYYSISLLEVPLFILIGINLQNRLLPIFSASCIVLFGISYAAWSLGYGIEGLAFSVGITFLALTWAVMILVLNQFNQSLEEKVLFLSHVYLPFFYAAGVLLLLDQAMGSPAGKGFQMVVRSLLQFAIFLAALVPVLVYMNKKISIVRRALRAIRSKDALNKVSFFED